MKEATRSATQRRDAECLRRLFSATLEFTSESPADAVVTADGRDGAYIGSGKGTVSGDSIRGTMSWSLYAGNCLYPFIRRGETVPDAVHLCTLSPGGFIDTVDGARIRFEGRGYGLRSPEWYRLSATFTFATESAPYLWLRDLLAVMEGDMDQKTGRAIWHVHAPIPRLDACQDARETSVRSRQNTASHSLGGSD
jgi:hypothetical protein